MTDLESKIQASIERLKSFEPADGYLLAFSGGKDSVVLKALADMAGVKYTAEYRVTGIDPPELVRFIKKHYPDVAWDIPRYPDDPKYPNPGGRVTMWNLIRWKKYPPTRLARYCCEWLKETSGEGKRVLTGVRWAESANRHNNQGIATVPKSTAKEVPEGLQRNNKGGVILNNDNDEARRMLETCYAKQKMMVNPIIDWTDEDVWEFIHSRNIPYCELYDKGWKRLGCIGCPMAGKRREKDLEAYPGYKKLWLKAFTDLQAERIKCGKEPLKSPDGREYDAVGLYGWWVQSKEVYGQRDLFAEMEVSQ